ncbi:FMN-binding protein [Micromonospora globispora]|uniref:FMN-binding protein n=1 Tax=Micromonospora globispora TaxID=1450148 RepID=UPI000D6F693E|nr:FMN-binding protein [Micromonospora globispora]PWU60090.1 FMN-binding protein [Micromonospora globispora]RQX06681.1 FMN-binding protein [Micromonospora globispora]
MRRAVLAITGLAASTTALVVLKGSPGASHVAQDLPADQASVAPGPRLTPGPGDSTTGPASVRPSAEPTTSRTSGTKTSTTAKATAAPKTTTSAPKTTTTRTVTGPVVSYKYGSLQVRITLSGTRIVDATGLGMPQSGGSAMRSDAVQAQYSGTSGEVVAKQSANLNTVSGATYTSNAYKQSLQAAIDKA